MNIYTLNVGQGQFVVITGKSEAVIVDTYVPLNPEQPIINIKAALAKILDGKNLVGLIVTGFDSDHFNEIGLKIILNKYRPNWLMYPKYFKQTSNAAKCFGIIKEFEKQKEITKISVLLKSDSARFYTKLSSDFKFEIFSPHSSDMNSSNNCSLVCKVIEKSTNASYLITGDTENDRWEAIADNFGDDLASDVLDAPHHGSKNGISKEALEFISPDTVIISAGVNNQYGHPDTSAVRLFKTYAVNCYKTNTNNGISIKTVAGSVEVNSYTFTV
jgi:competence protein ComEC